MQKKILSNIYIFNPTCEYAIVNGNASWRPNKLLSKMEADLSLLPIYLAEENDYVIVDNYPSDDFLSSFNLLNKNLPQFILKSNLSSENIDEDISISSLKPWGWSPAMHSFLAPLKKYCSLEFRNSPVFSWKSDFRELYSKRFSREMLTKFLEIQNDDIFISRSDISVICTNKNEINEAHKKWGDLMVKAAWSSSGRGLQIINQWPIHPKVWERIEGIINSQAFVLVEPLLNKKMDLTYQFNMQNGQLSYLGVSVFNTSEKGQYLGSLLNYNFADYDDGLNRFVQDSSDLIISTLTKIIQESTLSSSFEGYLGVDVLVYEDENCFKINPCLEINLRQSMGLLSLNIEKLLCENAKGKFSMWYEFGKSYSDFVKYMRMKYPLKIENSKIRTGFFSLSDPQNDSKFGAYILVF